MQPEYINRALVMHQLRQRLAALGVLADVLNLYPDDVEVEAPGVSMLARVNPSPLNWLVPPMPDSAPVEVIVGEVMRGAQPQLDWLGMTREQGMSPDTRRWFGDGRSPRNVCRFLTRLLLLAGRAEGLVPILEPKSLWVGPYALYEDGFRCGSRVYSINVGRLPSHADLSLMPWLSRHRLPRAVQTAGVTDRTVWALVRSAMEGFDEDAFDALEQQAFRPRTRETWRMTMPVEVPGVPRDTLLDPKHVTVPSPGRGSSDEVEMLLAQECIDMAALYRAAVPELCSARMFHKHIAPNPTAPAEPRRVRAETRRVWESLLLRQEHPAI